MVQKSGSMPALNTGHEAHHPGDRTYIGVAIFLAIVTGLEVLVYYIESIDVLLVPSLVFLSLVKFVFVVGYFMHLKFDSRLLLAIFVFGLIAALAVYIAAWVMMDVNAPTVFHGGR